MLTEMQIEQRLAAVEAAIRSLQAERLVVSASENWIEAVSGSFKDEPAFDLALALGRAIRESESGQEAETTDEVLAIPA